MANFKANLFDVNNNLDVKLSSDGKTFTFIDHSNYDTNTDSGHTRADFANFRKLNILFPKAVTSVEVVFPLPVTNDDDATHTGIVKDGVYKTTLFAVPTWKNTATYLLNDCIYYAVDTNLYKSKKATNNSLPTVTADWELLSDKSDLDIKYISSGSIIRKFDLVTFIEQKTMGLFCGTHVCLDSLCKNGKFKDLEELSFLEFALCTANDLKDYNRAQTLIDMAYIKADSCSC